MTTTRDRRGRAKPAGSPPAAAPGPKKEGGVLRVIGLGLITGAADDDPRRGRPLRPRHRVAAMFAATAGLIATWLM